MNKNDQLNQLFTEWEKVSDHINFFSDGIINEEKFNQASSKILFLTKEPNYPNKDDKILIHDYRTEWSNEKGLSGKFTLRMAEWAYGILNGFKPYDSIWPQISKNKHDSTIALESLQSIAFMNLKKSGGGGSSNEKTINEYLSEHKDLVLKQIKIIDPEIIITGLSCESTVDMLFPDNIDWKQTGYTTVVARYGNAKVIDFYHPSSRSSAAALYCLLEKVSASDEFKRI